MTVTSSLWPLPDEETDDPDHPANMYSLNPSILVHTPRTLSHQRHRQTRPQPSPSQLQNRITVQFNSIQSFGISSFFRDHHHHHDATRVLDLLSCDPFSGRSSTSQLAAISEDTTDFQIIRCHGVRLQKTTNAHDDRTDDDPASDAPGAVTELDSEAPCSWSLDARLLRPSSS